MGGEYNEAFIKLFDMIMRVVVKIVPPDTDLTEVYENASDADQQFIQNLALFLSAFLVGHLKAVEAASGSKFKVRQMQRI